MAGDDDPKSSAHEDDDDDDQFHDPYNDFGHFTEEDLLNVMSDSNPNLMDFVFTNAHQNPPPPPPPAPQDPNMEINETQMLQELSLNIPSGDTNSEFESFEDDLYLSWDMFESPSDDPNNNNVQGEIRNDSRDGNNLGAIGRLEVSTRVFGEDRMNFVVGTGRLEVSTRVFGENRTNFEIDGPSTRPVPVTPTISNGIFLCTCCQPLRGLVHTNGREVMRLDIYGEIGSFCHAILETQPFADSNKRRFQTLPLKDLKMEDVKRFIENYLSEREASGFRLVQDTNAAFYQAVNACSNNNQPPMLTMSQPNDVPMSLAMPNEALNVPSVPQYVGLRDEPTGTAKVRPRRNTPLAAQRERTGKLTLEDVGKHFHLPIEKAARKMDVCPTVLKKICRRGGLPRWPHRKIKSLQRKIAALKDVALEAKDPDVRAAAEEEIVKLDKQIKEICSEAIQNSKEL